MTAELDAMTLRALKAEDLLDCMAMSAAAMEKTMLDLAAQYRGLGTFRRGAERHLFEIRALAGLADPASGGTTSAERPARDDVEGVTAGETAREAGVLK